MPATSAFTPCVLFDWPVPAPVPAPAPPRRKKKKRKRNAVVPASIRSVMVERLEHAVECELIALCDEDMPCDSLDFTLAEYALLLRILIPEEYEGPTRKPLKRASDTAPASADRIAAYAERRDQGRPLWHPGDPGAVSGGRQLVEVERRNGSGRQVVGWSEA
jgi:hypothetical protein